MTFREIIRAKESAHEDVLTTAENAPLHQVAPAASSTVTMLTSDQIARARDIQSSHLAELVKTTGVQGVAITSTADSPGDAAILVCCSRKHSLRDPPSIDLLTPKLKVTCNAASVSNGDAVSCADLTKGSS